MNIAAQSITPRPRGDGTDRRLAACAVALAALTFASGQVSAELASPNVRIDPVSGREVYVPTGETVDLVVPVVATRIDRDRIAARSRANGLASRCARPVPPSREAGPIRQPSAPVCIVADGRDGKVEDAGLHRIECALLGPRCAATRELHAIARGRGQPSWLDVSRAVSPAASASGSTGTWTVSGPGRLGGPRRSV